MTASTSAKSASSQPTMKARVPASAAVVPPETGASAKRKPAALACSATARALSTSMVEQSISNAVFGALGRISLGVDLADVQARRQHGDDHVGVLHRLGH